MKNIRKKFAIFFINSECVNSEIFSKNEYINQLLNNSKNRRVYYFKKCVIIIEN